MKHSDFSKLPITISSSDRVGCFRVLHLLIGTPVALLGVWSLYWGDMSAIVVLAGVVAFSGTCELLGYFINRHTVVGEYTITRDGVAATRGQEIWFEPLAAYSGIEWRERDPIGEGMTDWRVDLQHGAQSSRSVCLLEPGRLSRNLDADLRAWNQLKDVLDLGGTRSKVSSWDDPAQEVVPEDKTNAAAEQSIKTESENLPWIKARRSIGIWGTLPIYFFGLVLSMNWRLTNGATEASPATEDGLILAASIGFILIAAWSLTTITLRQDGQCLTMTISLWRAKFTQHSFERDELSDVSTSFSGFGVGVITLHFSDSPPVSAYMVRSSDVRRMAKWLDPIRVKNQKR
ncbi:hypothetical protein [Aliiroseovarius sp. PrR006]|uniref:hypothetical protein n=1 Tax=Aliiroseovarius sp. PrR006 TaxID=2706883 RepID=UPI0013D53571|nr:hypothetical protein [Aliiroseovarius sp. PrR006]NDW53893.1 hypothetical protein [Aliiroseovarius sp. PrR006]